MDRISKVPHLADDYDPEDSIDPKDVNRKPWDAPKSASRKARQLCEQVKDALHNALASCADEVLQALSVIAVEPAPHTGRLKVRLTSDWETVHPAEATTHLLRAAGMLRGEVAHAIHRRHTPELTFEVV